MKYDFAVVGGGPAGCIAAGRALEKGDVILFEEHKKQPVHCAGLISVSGFERLEIKKKHFVLNEVKGAKLFSPLGTIVEIRAKEAKAYVVDRSLFDGFLLNSAVSKGVSCESMRVLGIENSVLHTQGGEFKAEKTILATGTDYNLQKACKLDCPDEFLLGAQYEMDVECDRDLVELHFVVPDFFAWIVPLEDKARVGLCTKSNPKPFLDSFVSRLAKQNRVKGSRVQNESYGIIPLYNPKLRTQYGKINLVGDAAGHVKATTGGGVVMGGVAAEYACMEDYERLWRRNIGADLRLHLWIHRFVNRLSPQNLDRLFKITSESRNSLESGGDMDYAQKTVKALFKNPKFTLKFLLNTPSFLLDLL
ncbi:MAG: geranylgeranyl reductase family protein [Candidatus Altiarchaeales archaeon]|nr:geranylgeranyl reductase family protein [Candidatus Altiarchaeales archaeon]